MLGICDEFPARGWLRKAGETPALHAVWRHNRAVLDGLEGRRVLVADDERHICRLIQVNLERQGYEVTLAVDGQKAIDELDAHEFDLAILDLTMPSVDGYQVLTWIRTHERSAGMRVWLMVDDADFWQARHEREHQADFYQKKSGFDP